MCEESGTLALVALCLTVNIIVMCLRAGSRPMLTAQGPT